MHPDLQMFSQSIIAMMRYVLKCLVIVMIPRLLLLLAIASRTLLGQQSIAGKFKQRVVHVSGLSACAALPQTPAHVFTCMYSSHCAWDNVRQVLGADVQLCESLFGLIPNQDADTCNIFQQG